MPNPAQSPNAGSPHARDGRRGPACPCRADTSDGQGGRRSDVSTADGSTSASNPTTANNRSTAIGAPERARRPGRQQIWIDHNPTLESRRLGIGDRAVGFGSDGMSCAEMRRAPTIV
jgi:hypothetical protein